MRKIKLNYVGCSTARENLLVAHNTWLTEYERSKIIDVAKNGSDEECEIFKVEIEKELTCRINASMALH